MSSKPLYTIIIPYFCQEEVARYLKIAASISEFPEPNGDVVFLLASSPRTTPSPDLQDAFSQIGKTLTFACPTQIFGYPEGPTAMFWDCMGFIAENFGDRPGFSLWLESDMAPTQPNWVDRLSQEWFAQSEAPLLMGCFVPEIYKRRIFKPKKLMLNSHINGGACYSLDFAGRMPQEARDGVFDMAVYPHALKAGLVKSTGLIAFSTTRRVRRDLLDRNKVLLHGFMQEKDLFIERCLAPLTVCEQRASFFNPVIDKLEKISRRLKVHVVRHGKQAMFENMLLTKHEFETSQQHQARHARHRAA